MPGQHGGFLRNVRTTVEVVPGLVTALSNGAGVDMQANGGWDGVAFQLAIGDLVGAATLDVFAQHSANSNFSGAVNITNAIATQIDAAQANIVVTIDVFRPTNRYVRLAVLPTTNNANVSAVAHRYRGQGRSPVTLPTNSQYVTVAVN